VKKLLLKLIQEQKSSQWSTKIWSYERKK